jgi:hypothetical protein
MKRGDKVYIDGGTGDVVYSVIHVEGTKAWIKGLESISPKHVAEVHKVVNIRDLFSANTKKDLDDAS